MAETAQPLQPTLQALLGTELDVNTSNPNGQKSERSAIPIAQSVLVTADQL